MKIVLISEKNLSKVTFHYTELSIEEKTIVIDSLMAYKHSDLDMRDYNNLDRIAEHKKIDKLLKLIKSE